MCSIYTRKRCDGGEIGLDGREGYGCMSMAALRALWHLHGDGVNRWVEDMYVVCVQDVGCVRLYDRRLRCYIIDSPLPTRYVFYIGYIANPDPVIKSLQIQIFFTFSSTLLLPHLEYSPHKHQR